MSTGRLTHLYDGGGPLPQQGRYRRIKRPARPQRSGEGRVYLVLFLILLMCYAYFFPRWAEWNQNSRMDLTLAIVEQGHFAIDDYYENTGDYAVYGDHVYTDKAPGTAFLGVPAYAAFQLLARVPAVETLLQRLSDTEALRATLREEGTGLLEEKVRFAAALYFVTLCVVSLPSASLGALLYRFLGRILKGEFQRVLLVLGYGLATIAFPYSTVFYGHQIAAVLLFTAFYLAFRIRLGELSVNYLWGVGALLGLTVLIEFPALVAGGLLGLYILWFLYQRSGFRGWGLGVGRLILAGLPFAFLLGLYNASCFGSPLASSYRYLGRFPEISNTGFLGFTAPRWEAFWGVTFSPYRGLFFLSPFLLWAVPGLWVFVRDREWRLEGVLSVTIVAAHLLLISSWYDWRGGFAIGPRNLLLILPYLVVAVAFFLRRFVDSLIRSFAYSCFGLSLLVSFALVWVASTSGQYFPPITIAHPLVEFFWPQFIAGDITRNLGMALGLHAWWSLLPPVLAIGVTIGGLAWILRGKRGLLLSRVQ